MFEVRHSVFFKGLLFTFVRLKYFYVTLLNRDEGTHFK